jgi:hypothetical protein
MQTPKMSRTRNSCVLLFWQLEWFPASGKKKNPRIRDWSIPRKVASSSSSESSFRATTTTTVPYHCSCLWCNFQLHAPPSAKNDEAVWTEKGEKNEGMRLIMTMIHMSIPVLSSSSWTLLGPLRGQRNGHSSVDREARSSDSREIDDSQRVRGVLCARIHDAAETTTTAKQN